MKLHRSLVALAVAAACTTSTAGFAGESMTHPFPPAKSDALEKFGGEEGVHDWVEALFYYIMLDTRINKIFREFGNPERQIYLNTQLETFLLGGDVEYQGASMAAAHQDLGITMTQFNAVVEAAYNACERVNVDYHTCNDLIAVLAPFTDDIVTK
ncbi:MAG TPA: group 1 truncated hemoglobin [Nevskiaceae bacterium]|nr:group 1 truncated hemoglobin [Nevskiaceae bacterium]